MKNLKNKTNQKGVALAIGLMLLLIIAVIGVNSMKSAILQEKMAGGLSNYNYADVAATSLLVAVENYVNNLFISNNGTHDGVCGYCIPTNIRPVYTDATSDIGIYRDFTTSKSMGIGSNFPGSTNVISSIASELHDEPEYILYQLEDGSSAEGGFGATVGEEGGGSGSGGGVDGLKVITYLIASKANDKTGATYVLNESIYAGVLN